MAEQLTQASRDWPLEHYAAIGTAYGHKHFTRPDSAYTTWILEQIAAVKPDAETIAEVGAGTCVFASLLGSLMQSETEVVCYEPVQELLEGASAFDNIHAVCGGAVEFASGAADNTFDLIFTKDAAHHFRLDSLVDVHRGFCRKLKPGGRYVMMVRADPDNELVPVGRIASSKWKDLYTPLEDLLSSMRSVPEWVEIETMTWQQTVETRTRDWIDGVRQRDSWSVFSALNSAELAATVEELENRFCDTESFDFLHQYDVAVFEKPAERHTTS